MYKLNQERKSQLFFQITFHLITILLLVILLFVSANLSAQENHRVEGSFYKFNEAADTLFLTSEDMSESERFALQSLMGNLAKTKPVILRDLNGQKEIVEKYGYVLNRKYYNNFKGLLTHFANRVDGYILCDANQKSANVAISLAGIMNGVAIPANIESKAKAAGLKLIIDVRGKDENWALENYGDQFSTRIASYQALDRRWIFAGDYSVYNNAFQFWDDNADGALANKAYKRMDSGATFLGWGPDEYKTIKKLSEYNCVMHPSDFAANMTTLSNIPCTLKQQKEPIEQYKSETDVHTVCFVISDGDNVQWLLGAHNDPTSWRNPNQARLSLGWTVSPALAELAPIVYNKYLENMESTQYGRNTLIAGPSGRGYFFPGLYSDVASEAALTNRFMKKADLSVVNIIDEFYTPSILEPYLSQTNIDAMFYYLHSNYSGLMGNITWYKDKPCIGGRFTCHGEGWNHRDRDPVSLAAELNKLPKDIHSQDGYSLIPVHIWSVNVNGVLEVIKNLGPNVRVVDPEEFVWLLRKNLRNLPMGTGNGLKGEYFGDANFSNQTGTQTDPKISFNKENNPLNGNTENEQLSVRWSGEVQPLYSEEYTFYVNTKAGVKLKINQQELFNSLANGSDSIQIGKIELEAGIRYEIVLEYSQKEGIPFCELEWESESHVRQTIPKTQLYSAIEPTVGTTITAYTEANFNGFSTALSLGEYSLEELNQLGIPDNSISSIQLVDGFKVILYENDNYEGASLEITAANSDLSENNLWNNKVSSLKVLANGETDLEGLYHIQNVKSNLCLDVAGGVGGTGERANVQQWHPTQRANQMFHLQHMGNGIYSILAMHSLKSLDVENMKTSEAANIYQLTNFKSPNQQFIIRNTGDNTYNLIAVHSGKIIDISNGRTDPEANVVQKTNTNQSSGKWKLILADVQLGVGDGLKGQYYHGQNFNNYLFSRVDSSIYFKWGDIAPDPRMRNDDYSVRWTGQIQPLFTGNHNFYINSDNGRRLWINDQLIIDGWINDWGVEYSGTAWLMAGFYYDIKMEYFEDAGGAQCILEWSSDQIKSVVPKSQLYSKKVTSSDNLKESSSEIFPYPNPTKGNIVLHGLKKDANLEIYNSFGSKVYKTTGQNIDISHLPVGLYTLKIKTPDLQSTYKISKQN